MRAAALGIVLLWLALCSAQQQEPSPRQRFRISLNATLSPGQPGWLSGNGTFELGFFPVSPSSYVLGIWYAYAGLGGGGRGAVPLTVVWAANRNSSVGEGALLRFQQGNLMLFSSAGAGAGAGAGMVVWESNTAGDGVVEATFLPSGNLQLLNASSGVVWETFDSPTDTLLPGQSLARRNTLRAWRAAQDILLLPNSTFSVPDVSFAASNVSAGYGDPAPGLYSAVLRSDGGFAVSWNSSTPFFLSPGADQANVSLFRNASRVSKLTALYAVLDAGGKFALVDKNARDVFSWQANDSGTGGSVLRRMTLDADGNFRMWSWSSQTRAWRSVWEAVGDPCRVYGVCGTNGLCSTGTAGEPVCSCPPGLQADAFSADAPCRPPVPFSPCQSGSSGSNFSEGVEAEFLGGSSFTTFNATSADACKDVCLRNCSCAALLFSNTSSVATCELYSSALLGTVASSASTVFFKVGQLDDPIPPRYPIHKVGGRRHLETWKVAAIAIGCSAAVLALLILVLTCYCCCVKKRKVKVVSSESKSGTPVRLVARQGAGEHVNARAWTYKELRRATKSFDQPLGDGRFGPLFKGVLPDGTVVAVRILRKPVPVDPVGEAHLSETRLNAAASAAAAASESETLASGMRAPRNSVETGSGPVPRAQASSDASAILALKRSDDEKVLLPREIVRSSSQDAAYLAALGSRGSSGKARKSRSLGLGLGVARQISVSFGFATPGLESAPAARYVGGNPRADGDSDDSKEFSRTMGNNSAARSGPFGSFFGGVAPEDIRYSVQSQKPSSRRAPHSGELRYSQELGMSGVLSRNASVNLPPDTVLFESTVFHGDEEQQFRGRVEELGHVNHVNLVRLVGFCIEGRRRLLVYNFVENGSIAKFLFQRKSSYNLMDWSTRFDIAMGAANGIAYLHDQCRPSIIHGDIRPESIVLDGQFKARVTDFGLIQLILGNDRERIVSYMQGRHPYLAPEWAAGLPITLKVDVYSFGLVLLEIVSGRRSFDPSVEGEQWNFPAWAYQQLELSNFGALADEHLGALFDQDQLVRVVRTAFWCLQDEAEMRPSMPVVVLMLEGGARIPLPVPPPRLIQGLRIESVPSNIATDAKKLVSVESDGEDGLEG